MSKYRIDIYPSKLKLFSELSFYGVLVLSLMSWQPYISDYAWVIKLSVFLLIATCFFKRCAASAPVNRVINLDESDACLTEFSTSKQADIWQLCPQSRIGFAILWMRLVSSNGSQRKWLYIARDQVSEQSYRRLSRAIFYRQYQAVKGE